MKKLIVTMLLLVSTSSFAEDDIHLLNGFTITPGTGLRHLGLDVIRKSDSFTGNIAQDVGAKIFFSLSIESPRYRFDNSNWGLSVLNINTFTTLDSQWHETFGERINVGSSVSGRYSYLVPQIFYEGGNPAIGRFKFSLGFGLWNADFSGNIRLTADDTPSVSDPLTDIQFSTTQMAYLMTLSWRTADNWIYEMSLGGPEFSDDSYKYKIEEVTLTIGKTFVF